MNLDCILYGQTKPLANDPCICYHVRLLLQSGHPGSFIRTISIITLQFHSSAVQSSLLLYIPSHCCVGHTNRHDGRSIPHKNKYVHPSPHESNSTNNSSSSFVIHGCSLSLDYVWDEKRLRNRWRGDVHGSRHHRC